MPLKTILEAKAEIKEIEPKDNYRRYELIGYHYYFAGQEIMEQEFNNKVEELSHANA